MATNFFFTSFAVLISMIIFMRIILKKKSRSKTRLPPGDMGLPWIGETMEFYKAQQKNKLFESFVQPRTEKYGKIFKTRLMGSPTIVVNGAEANRFLLSNEFKLVISSWPSSSVELMGKNSIMERQGEAHKKIRGIIATSLGFTALEGLVPRICGSVQSHLNRYWLNKDEVSLYRMSKTMTFTVVCECLLGINADTELLGMFERLLEGIFAPPINYPGSKFSKAKKAREGIQKVFTRVVRQKKEDMEGKSDVEGVQKETLLSLFVAELISGKMTEEEVVDNVVLLVFAAQDTTTSSISMIFRMMARNPHCYSLLLQEHIDIMSEKEAGENVTLKDTKKMKYTWQVARESMRLFPPVFGSFRKAMVDIEYEGFLIPKGWKVLWTTYGTHYNQVYFKDPLSFDPSRFDEPIEPYAFLPFGGGPRVCAGFQLAKLNMLVFIHHVVTRFDWSPQFPDEKIIMDPTPFPSQGMPINISPKL